MDIAGGLSGQCIVFVIEEQCLMRSSVIGTKYGRQPTGAVRKDSQYERLHQTQEPDPNNERPRIPLQQLVSRYHLKLVPLEGWSPLLLLAIALYSVVSSIIAAKWVSFGSLLFVGPVVGLLAGLITAKVPRLPQAILHLAACLMGYWLAIWLTCVPAFHISWKVMLGSIHAVLLNRSSTNVLPANNVIFFFYLAFLCYFLAYFGCWLIYRAHLPWLVALVYGSIALVNLNYAHSDSYYLIAILAVALILLVARVQLVSQLLQWTGEGLYTDPSWRRKMKLRCMLAACIVALLTLLLSWLLPIQTQPTGGKEIWDGIDNAVTNVANGHIAWQDPAALIQPYQPPSNYFTDRLTVTGNVQLPPGEVLFYVSPGGPHYLEGSTFNVFDGHTWTSTLTEQDASNYDANEPLPQDVNRAGLNVIKTQVTILRPPGGTKPYLFAPPQPRLFNVASTVYSDGTTGAWVQQKSLTRNETYQVTSLEPLTDVQALKAVPLPNRGAAVWQRDPHYAQMAHTYTQIPSKLSPLVQQTAMQWTQGATDAYSALKDLEAHLNDAGIFTYSVTNPPVPASTDVATWLLQTRRGYCTYYASTMAVMARLMGIPTRIVTGFSQGTYDQLHNSWAVMGTDAHSWVQAYLPSIGWINFDPTPGYAPGAAPVQKTATTLPKSPVPQPTAPKTQPIKKLAPVAQHTPQVVVGVGTSSSHSSVNSTLMTTLLIVGLVLLLGLLLGVGVASWWRNLYAKSSFTASKFWRLCWLAGLFGLAPKQWQTPYEYGAMLSRHFPQHTQSLWRLTEMFVRERWGAPYQVLRKEEEQVVAQFWPSLLRMFLKRDWIKIHRS
jgi:transglutaminase-like putative cysteine protease